MTGKKRTDDEWMVIIQECKSSGYSDVEWCRLNGIAVSTFYRKLNLLREKAEIQEVSKPIIQQQQDVVEVHFQDEIPKYQKSITQETALSLNLNGITVDIFNNATKDTIENTLYALRSLCQVIYLVYKRFIL